MGYETDFEGKLEFSSALTEEHRKELQEIFTTHYPPSKVSSGPRDPKPSAEFVPYHYCPLSFIGVGGSLEATALVVESGKAYSWQEWIDWLLEFKIIPWGYKLNGMILWRGEDGDDVGKLEVEDNVVRVFQPPFNIVLKQIRGPVKVDTLINREPILKRTTRAVRAAMDVYRKETGGDEEDSLSDLLADLMHWADEQDFDFEAALARAEGHYEHELKDLIEAEEAKEEQKDREDQ